MGKLRHTNCAHVVRDSACSAHGLALWLLPFGLNPGLKAPVTGQTSFNDKVHAWASGECHEAEPLDDTGPTLGGPHGS